MLKKLMLAVLCLASSSMMTALSVDVAMRFCVGKVDESFSCVLNQEHGWQFSIGPLFTCKVKTTEVDGEAVVTMHMYGRNEKDEEVLVAEPVFKTAWDQEATLAVTDDADPENKCTLYISVTPHK